MRFTVKLSLFVLTRCLGDTYRFWLAGFVFKGPVWVAYIALTFLVGELTAAGDWVSEPWAGLMRGVAAGLAVCAALVLLDGRDRR